jgi:nucleoside-diphosphate-sugar epimerase
MRVLVTGATGFVGNVLCETLAARGHHVRAALRSARAVSAAIAEQEIVGEIDSRTDWTRALAGIDAVVHAAARVHVLNDNPANTALYEETNTLGTRQLATAAASARVRRFVFLSSVKVNGEETSGRPYTASDTPRPVDPYGVSKWHAEQHLRDVASGSAMSVAIVRPPLVYGPGVRANFLRLLSWVAAGKPLPFGSVDNRRSLVNVWNLADLLCTLVERDTLPADTWMISDGEDVSTPELIRRIAKALGRPGRLIPVPEVLFHLAGRLLGKSEYVRRVCGSLAVDISPALRDLGWRPPVSMHQALERTAQWFLATAQPRDV